MPDSVKACECGCGGQAPIAPCSNKRRGWVRGEPLRFIRGHNSLPGAANLNWRGKNVSYSGAHKRIVAMRGKPTECQQCGKVKGHRIEWANLTGRYDDPTDYIPLCAPCHRKLDFGKSVCKRGHPRSGQNLYVWKGRKFCRACLRIARRNSDRRTREKKMKQ